MNSRSYGNTCMPVFGVILTIAVIILPTSAWTQPTGEQLFQSTCAACHTIGSGRLVGPDLSGVTNRRSKNWLQNFIKSSQSLIKSGDVDAVSLFEDFNGMIMPDFPLTDAQVAEVLVFIGANGSTADLVADTSAALTEVTPPAPLSMDSVLKGQDLFQGITRFRMGGSSCNACHDVKHDAVIGGGILAAELTTVFSRMGGSGVGAILGQAPFPVMQAAYKNNALMEDEINYLIAFLQNADEQHLLQQPRDYGLGLFASGAVGAGGLYLFFALLWRGRKRGSVNQNIYDRQIRSFSDKES